MSIGGVKDSNFFIGRTNPSDPAIDSDNVNPFSNRTVMRGKGTSGPTGPLNQIKHFLDEGVMGDVTHDEVVDINNLLETLPKEKLNEVISELSDQDLKHWADQVVSSPMLSYMGGLDEEDQLKMFEGFAANLDGKQLARVYRAYDGTDAQEFMISIICEDTGADNKVEFVQALAGKFIGKQTDAHSGAICSEPALFGSDAQAVAEILESLEDDTPALNKAMAALNSGQPSTVTSITDDIGVMGTVGISSNPDMGDTAFDITGDIGSFTNQFTQEGFVAYVQERFGNIPSEAAKKLYNDIKDGTIAMPKIVVSDEGLNGNYASYNRATDTIQLSADLVESAKSNPMEAWRLRTAVVEETGHFIDDQLRNTYTSIGGDAAGDEGAGFAKDVLSTVPDTQLNRSFMAIDNDGAQVEITTDSALRQEALKTFTPEERIATEDFRADTNVEYMTVDIYNAFLNAPLGTFNADRVYKTSKLDGFRQEVTDVACKKLEANRQTIDKIAASYENPDAAVWDDLKLAVEKDQVLLSEQEILKSSIHIQEEIIRDCETLLQSATELTPDTRAFYEDRKAKAQKELKPLLNNYDALTVSRQFVHKACPALDALDTDKIDTEKLSDNSYRNDVFSEMKDGLKKAKKGITKSIEGIKKGEIPLEILTPVIDEVKKSAEFEGLESEIDKWVSDYNTDEMVSQLSLTATELGAPLLAIGCGILGLPGVIAGGVIGGAASVIAGYKDIKHSRIIDGLVNAEEIGDKVLDPDKSESADFDRYMAYAGIALTAVDFGVLGAAKRIAKLFPVKVSIDDLALPSNFPKLKITGDTGEDLALWKSYFQKKDPSLTATEFDAIVEKGYGIPNYSDVEDFLGESIDTVSKEKLNAAGYRISNYKDGRQVISRYNADDDTFVQLTVKDGKIKLAHKTDDVKFPEELDPEDVLNVLKSGAMDVADNADALASAVKESRKPFKAYMDVLTGKGIVTEQDVLDVLKNIKTKGRTIGEVRHDLKNLPAFDGNSLNGKILDEITSMDKLKNKYNSGEFKTLWKTNEGEALARASHAEMLDITKNLGPADKGSLAEKWYKELFVPNAATQVDVKVDQLNDLGLKGNRRIDLLEGNTLHEIKTISGKMQEHDLEQFEDFMKLISRDGGSTIIKGANSYKVEEAVYTFTVPEGVAANAKWMKEELMDNENLIFEVFNAAGERLRIGSDQAVNFDKIIQDFLEVK